VRSGTKAGAVTDFERFSDSGIARAKRAIANLPSDG
jgi:hypothetical protein